jgi:glucan endo-1,3-alpha-glucosidase
MSAVSPWFFTVCSRPFFRHFSIIYLSLKHYGPDSWNKNWIYRGDEWLYIRRWEMLVDNREHIDIVQILSWNGEFC